MKLRTRSQRSLGPRPRTMRARDIARQNELEQAPLFDWAVRTGRWGAAPAPERPKTRGECVDGPRPCPWASCKYHLALDVKDNGLVRITFPGKEIDELKETCALDVADRVKPRELSLEQVGELVNVTSERVHVMVRAFEERVRAMLGDGDGDDE